MMTINIAKYLSQLFFLITNLHFSAYAKPQNAAYITLVDGNLVEQVFPQKELAAIVNAANEELLGGGGIDGIIWNEVAKANSQGISGAKEFQAQCHVLRRKKAKGGYNQYRGDIDQITDGSESSYVAGDAGLTHAFGKLADRVGYVIHAVGPRGIHSNELRNAYQNSLDRAAEAKLKVVAFCPISTGIFGYPIEAATYVAIQAIVDWLRDHPACGIEEIRLVTWVGNPNEYMMYKKVLQTIKLPALEEESIITAKDIIAAQRLGESSQDQRRNPPGVFCVKIL